MEEKVGGSEERGRLVAGVCFCAAVGMKITTAARREL